MKPKEGGFRKEDEVSTLCSRGYEIGGFVGKIPIMMSVWVEERDSMVLG
jgi:hypothetical protein